MRSFITMASALALSLALPAVSLADDHGRGRGGQDHAERGHGGGRGGDDHGRGRGGDHERGGHERAGPGRGDGGGRERAEDRREDRREARVERVQRQVEAREARGPEREDRDRARRYEREPERRVERRVERRDELREAARREVVRFDRRGRGLIDGCPPGLAWRDNGCLPPGQARRRERDDRYERLDRLWRSREAGYVYRYDDGYLYRMTPQGGLAGYLPVLGGALAPGALWPSAYAAQPLPDYYGDYYRLEAPLDYRYADGVVYGVDPTTQAIRQVVALLTGDQWAVGQPMPSGYDVYNVPYGYRDRYVDTPETWHRYSDGYVYQVDPTTQLVMAAIQLLT